MVVQSLSIRVWYFPLGIVISLRNCYFTSELLAYQSSQCPITDKPERRLFLLQWPVALHRWPSAHGLPWHEALQGANYWDLALQLYMELLEKMNELSIVILFFLGMGGAGKKKQLPLSKQLKNLTNYNLEALCCSPDSSSGDTGSSMTGSAKLVWYPDSETGLASRRNTPFGLISTIGFSTATLWTVELTILFSDGPGRASLALHRITWIKIYL
ncbi:hypothetical protein CFOL_v3_05325 [Cephalotus follicularis]|uniref:Uncharacterized protein n=1 Tax=Cephalotus follicularis TaxID=3775 RepID=A0A1Q3B1G1_CEPFO|nr:hypothetical protein CFOL_v3_05325 [Cephalotus follicularis]